MNIKFNDLTSQWNEISSETLPKIIKVLENGNYILGEEVSIFEKNFAKWNNNKYAVGVGNGTDALIISVSSLELPGKSIFYIPSNTYIATLLGVVLSTNKNYNYKLIDCDEFFQIDVNILENEIIKNLNDYDNHVVIPVHLYGGSCNMSKIMELKEKFNLKIIEDCSQSHGTITSENRRVGTYGDVSAFSLYPGKNLGASGDAGIIVTDNEEIYKKCLMIRNLGSIEKYKHDVVGRNSRLDTIQSVILNEKLKKIDSWNSERVRIAEFFKLNINNPLITIPKKSEYCKYNTYHIFPIITDHRELFMDFLKKEGIPSLVHYPIPIERTGAFLDPLINNLNTLLYSDKIVSIPMHPFLNEDEILHICNTINKFVI